MTLILHPKMFPVWLLALVMLWLAPIVGGVISHALARHGTEAAAAQGCSDGGHGARTFFNAANGRYAEVCEVDGKWAVRIVDKWGREITAFVKNNVKNFEGILRYMRKSGYELLQ